jgi:hypothetical protein
MRRVIVGLVVVLGVLGGAAPRLGAQEARVVRVGQAATGTLSAQDPTYGSRGGFHAYRFEAKAGTRYQVTMKSSDVDAYLWVAKLVGGVTEEIAADDDGAGDTDARLRFRAATAGTYMIVAQSLEVAAVGAYEVRVEELSPTAPPTAVALKIGEAKEGVLDDRSAMLEEGRTEVPYQLYTFSGNGQRVRVAVRSGAFDASMRVTRVTAAGEEEVGTDDDSGGGTDAQMVFIANGDYRIYAKPLEAGKSGSFTVSISEMVVRPVATKPLTIGQMVEASIESTDPELDDGRNFHQYAFTARPGERLVITMRSSAFDAFLDWGSVSPGGFESSSTDDDSAGDTDARLEVVMPADGTYVIRVYGLEKGKLGAYSLMVERRAGK